MRRGEVVDLFHAEVHVAVIEQKVKPITEYPVAFRFVFYLSRALDWVNTAAMAKAAEDGLRKAGILEDDTKKFVDHGTLEYRKKPKTAEYEYCEIYLENPCTKKKS